MFALIFHLRNTFSTFFNLFLAFISYSIEKIGTLSIIEEPEHKLSGNGTILTNFGVCTLLHVSSVF
jgi:hypothetical protein